VRRADLGWRLRQLREAAGLSQQQAAAALEFSDSKVSRIETGEVSAPPRDIGDLAELYGATPQERDVLKTAAREWRTTRAAQAKQRRQYRSPKGGPMDHPTRLKPTTDPD
jgi:transcriptional regulator with XRE-family HTH domain